MNLSLDLGSEFQPVTFQSELLTAHEQRLHFEAMSCAKRYLEMVVPMTSRISSRSARIAIGSGIAVTITIESSRGIQLDQLVTEM
jgi:hypothetical protein